MKKNGLRYGTGDALDECTARFSPMALRADHAMTASLLHTSISSPAVGPRVRVCVSLPFARQLLLGGASYFGGAEVRGATFVAGLASDPALEVHVVVSGAESTPVVRSDGVTVHFRPGVSFFEGHMDDAVRSIWAVVDADVYLAFGASEASAELARFCQAHGSAFVLSIASDCSFDAFVGEHSTACDAYDVPGRYHWYAMHHAHEVIVQTERQRTLFRALDHRDATVIRNPALSHARAVPRTSPRFGGRLLWIGRIDPNKRYEEALLLADALPHRRIIMVCNGVRTLGAAVAGVEAALPNLSLADQVALPDIDNLFRFCDVLVNTSIVEGFPNTFLQAGMHGIPIVSMTVDPDGMLATYGCGRVADGTRSGLTLAVDALLSDQAAYAAASAASARWVQERHDASDRIADLRVLLHRAAAAHASHRVRHAA